LNGKFGSQQDWAWNFPVVKTDVVATDGTVLMKMATMKSQMTQMNFHDASQNSDMKGQSVSIL